MSQLTDTTAKLAPAITESSPAPANPFARTALPAHVNAAAVAVESERAIAEVQGALVIAKKFPRDPAAAYASCIESCARPGLANTALYTYKRGGSTVSGPSIRLAEELARCWGNIVFGMNELSNRDGITEVEAYAWDLETNTRTAQRFTVRHVRDTQQGKKDLTDERDIYEMGANMGSRRMRARILAVLPDDLVEAAVAEVRKTLAKGGTEPLADRVRKMLVAFGKVGVAQGLIETRTGKKVADFLPEDLVDLLGIYTSIRDGHTSPSEWFSVAPIEQPVPANDNKPDKPDKAAKPAKPKKAAAKKAEPAPEPEPEPETPDEDQEESGTEQTDDAPQIASVSQPATDGEDLF